MRAELRLEVIKQLQRASLPTGRGCASRHNIGQVVMAVPMHSRSAAPHNECVTLSMMVLNKARKTVLARWSESENIID